MLSSLNLLLRAQIDKHVTINATNKIMKETKSTTVIVQLESSITGLTFSIDFTGSITGVVCLTVGYSGSLFSSSTSGSVSFEGSLISNVPPIGTQVGFIVMMPSFSIPLALSTP